MKFPLLSLALASLISFSAAAQTKTKVVQQIPGIDSLLNRVLKDQYVAGFAVAVVKGDQVIYSKGFGYRDVDNKKPVTPNTLFAIGSSTKAFTAGLLGLLENDGKLKLDDKATSLLPNLQFYNNEMNNQVTVRDLMAHRTGLSRYDYSWLLFNTANRDSIISRVKYMQPTAGVREKWFYNNFMFLAQGMIAEKITGKTWEQNIKEKFFDPLEMNRSNTSMAAFKADADASLPYVIEKDSLIKKIDYYDINGMGPAGSINSSVNDIANWLKVWISGGKYKGKEILPLSYVKEASSSQMVMAPALPTKQEDIFLANYGLGWMIGSYRGHYAVEHGGNINGFSANVAFYPTDGLGIVVLTNQNVSAVPEIITQSIADRVLKLKPIDWNGEAKKAAAMAREYNKTEKANEKKNVILNTKPSHSLESYVGSFENPAYGLIKIENEKGQLYAKAGDNKLLLKHLHYDVFEPKSVDKQGVVDTAESKALINFASSNAGKISGLTMQLDPDKDPVLFKYKPQLLNVKDLQDLVGEYALGTTPVKVYLKGEVLYVAVPGQPDYETVFVDGYTFELKALKGFSVEFETVPGKKATSVLFKQPNGKFKAIRKK